MSFIVEPLELDQIEDYVAVQYAAFAAPDMDTMLPMIYPNGLQPDLVARFSQRLRNTLQNDPGARYFGAKDPATGKIVGISHWSYSLDPPKTPEQVDAIGKRATDGAAALPPVEGMHHALNDAFLKKLFAIMLPLMEGRPHMALIELATHPDHHRKGVGSTLLRHGLALADEAKLPTTVLASRTGKPLYERFGFELIRVFPFDARDYGGAWESKHWIMVRPAKT